MALGSRAVDSTGVAAFSGAPLRSWHQAHAFTSRLSPRVGRARALQVRADNALIINTKGTRYKTPRMCLDVLPNYLVLNRPHMLQGVAMPPSGCTL